MAYTYLIDRSFFYGEIPIVNADAVGVPATLRMFIDDMEIRFMKELFGIELYRLYIAGVEANTPKYIALRDGAAFIDRAGMPAEYKGLRYTNGTAKKSAIANYIYYWWSRKEATSTTPSGEKKADTQNASDASPAIKQARAWNEMVRLNRECVEFLLSNDIEYPEFYQYFYRGRAKGMLEFLNPVI